MAINARVPQKIMEARVRKKMRVQRKLKKTHKLIWEYKYVWERWDLNTENEIMI